MSFGIDIAALRKRAATRLPLLPRYPNSTSDAQHVERCHLATHATLLPDGIAAGSRVATVATHAQDLAQRLAAAINVACDARGDEDANRAALLIECVAQPPHMQADLLAHFVGVSRSYGAAAAAVRGCLLEHHP